MYNHPFKKIDTEVLELYVITNTSFGHEKSWHVHVNLDVFPWHNFCNVNQT